MAYNLLMMLHGSSLQVTRSRAFYFVSRGRMFARARA